MKRTLSLLLCLLTVLSLTGFLASCDSATVNDIADAALTLLEDAGETREADLTPSDLVLITDEEPVPSEEQQTDVPAAPEAENSTEDEQTEAQQNEVIPAPAEPEPESKPAIDENGSYDDKENVALYIYTYGKLPPNYISKKEAQNLGWSGGSLEKYASGKCIGGSYFGNYEGVLPAKKGREYHECDIGTLGKSSRGAKRIVFSNDGLIYYTEDHYESFELLYGTP